MVCRTIAGVQRSIRTNRSEIPQATVRNDRPAGYQILSGSIRNNDVDTWRPDTCQVERNLSAATLPDLDPETLRDLREMFEGFEEMVNV